MDSFYFKICFDTRQNMWRSSSEHQNDKCCENDYSNRSSTYLNDNFVSLQGGSFPQNQYNLSHSNQLLESNQRSLLNGSNSSASSSYNLLSTDALSIDYTAAAAAFNLKSSILNSPISYHHNHNTNHYSSNDNQAVLNSQLNNNSNDLSTAFNYSLVPSVNSSNLVSSQNLGSSSLIVTPTSLLNHGTSSSFHHPSIHHSSIQSDHSRRTNQHMVQSNQQYHLSNGNFDLQDNQYRAPNTTQNDPIHMNEGEFYIITLIS